MVDASDTRQTESKLQDCHELTGVLTTVFCNTPTPWQMLCQNYLHMISTKSQRRLQSKQTYFVTSSWSRFLGLLMLHIIHSNNYVSGLRLPCFPDTIVESAASGSHPTDSEFHVEWLVVYLSKALTVCNQLPYNTTMHLHLNINHWHYIYVYIYIYIYIYIW